MISAPFLPLNHHAQRLVLVRAQLLASPRPRSSLQASSPMRCASALGGCGRAPCAAHLPLWASRRAAARTAAAHIAAAALAPGKAAALAPGGAAVADQAHGGGAGAGFFTETALRRVFLKHWPL